MTHKNLSAQTRPVRQLELVSVYILGTAEVPMSMAQAEPWVSDYNPDIFNTFKGLYFILLHVCIHSYLVDLNKFD